MQSDQNGTDTQISDEQEDYAIFPHVEAIAKAITWKIGNYDEKGILSADEKSILVEQFHLPTDLIDELSIYIGNCLDSESEVNLTRITRSKALSRGAEGLERMAQLAHRLSHDCASCETICANMSAHFAETKDTGTLIDEIRHELARLEPVVDNLKGKIAQLMNTPGGAAELVPDDKRKSVDMRRQLVVQSCCHIWMDAGRKVSYTTKSHDPGAPQRSGPLIAFIQAVVGFVTIPSKEIPVETLRRDIDRFKKLQQAPDPLSTPPERG